MSSGVQHVRLRRPDSGEQKPPPTRHTGILQDKLRRTQRRPWSPSFSFALRVILLMRVAGAMYSNIDDCDEVYNFWEPLHFLDKGYGFQTWEVSPQYAIRSWAYVLLHLLPARLAAFLFGDDKRVAFFAVRISLAVISSITEVTLYRTIHEKINERVGRYFFFMLLFSAGMWNASAAFLPSSFAMYAVTLAFAYAFSPSSLADNRRTLAATALFATAGVVGWPFAVAIASPFVFEELFVLSADRVLPDQRIAWFVSRWKRLLIACLVSALIFVPVIAVDSIAYGRLSIVPWNIVRYNIFGGTERGPDLYGTSPWHFYVANLFLNFNILLPFALLALPALAITYRFDRQRLGFYTPSIDQSSPYTVLTIRLAPFYLWLGILTLQPHKEERFMFPAYPLLCFNAAVTVYLVRGWQEVIFIKLTNSPYRASRSSIFRNFTSAVIINASIISICRIIAMRKYYNAPLVLVYDFQYEELPRVLNVTGYLPEYPPNLSEEDRPRIDLSPIKNFNLTLCLGKEWYRFPGHYLIPDGIRVEFVKSDFSGLLPRHFEEDSKPENAMALTWWIRPESRIIPTDLNDLNREELTHYVPIQNCDYLVDLDFPKHSSSSPYEPRYLLDESTWQRVFCSPFLDASHSRLLTRILWMPGSAWQDQNEFGEYCLLRNKKTMARKEALSPHRSTRQGLS
ncbi:glycosyltransferase family 22 protein [Amanita thiersii Skay4041]|uniref:Mannosyltransferase n=1 Tax=Amanita thiersii Skay4041 TaxID=703135 RepID=A0A2A9NSA6_9AGAR|nr:glycosyltransferase family 22 protein [Amanita thiersii Skay4041]